MLIVILKASEFYFISVVLKGTIDELISKLRWQIFLAMLQKSAVFFFSTIRSRDEVAILCGGEARTQQQLVIPAKTSVASASLMLLNETQLFH